MVGGRQGVAPFEPVIAGTVVAVGFALAACLFGRRAETGLSAAAVLLLDQCAKLLTLALIPVGHWQWLLDECFGIGHFRNCGLMFGFDYFRHLAQGAVSPLVLTWADVGACLLWLVVVCGLLLRLRRRIHGRLGSAGSLALGLIVGGAASNLADRIVLQGFVVDYLVLCRWGDVYNLADLAILAGFLILAVDLLQRLDQAHQRRLHSGSEM